MTDRVGQQLGNYRLVQLLGEGGFSEVYLGEHLHLGTEAAIKILRTQLASTDAEQFLREARMIARLEHPHIIRVFDFGVEDATPFLVMSYAPNGTLRKRHPKGTRLSMETIVPYVMDVADALSYTHAQRLIHRDIKPENLLVGRNNEILLGDFGIALIAQSTHLHNNYDMAGTVAYMAPEQLQSHPRPASDQYSLGIIVYEWLCGDRPFTGTFTELVAKHSFVMPPPLRERMPGLPPAVEHVVMTALAKDPQQRFATVKAFAIALAQASGLPGYANLSQSLSLQTGPSNSFWSQMPTQLQSQQPVTPIPPASLTPVMPVMSSEHAGFPVVLSTPPGNVLPSADSSTTPDQPLLTPVLSHSDQPPPVPPLVSRRSLMVGLAGGLIGAGAVGGLAWYLVARGSRDTQVTATPTPTPRPVTSPSLSSQGAMFGYDVGRTHYNPKEKTLSASNVSRLVPVHGWKVTAGGSISASPAVAGNTVYIAAWDQRLHAFNATTGALKWKFATAAAIDSSPAVAGGIVYIASKDSMVYALDASTGKTVWNTPFMTGAPIDFSSPVIAAGILYIGSHDRKLYAVDAQTGEFLWSAQTKDAVWSSPAVANGIVYISSRDTKLYAYNARTGKHLWTASLNYGSDSSPAVANGIVYAGSYDHKVYAFNAQTGKSAWAAPFVTGGKINSSPAVAHGVVYIGSADNHLYALNAASGEPVWAAPAATGGRIESSPTVANGVVYVGSDDHKVYAFAVSNGKKLWSASTGSLVFSSPVVNNGRLYIASEDKKLYAFHLSGT